MAVIEHGGQKELGGKKVCFIHLTAPYHSPLLRKIRARVKAEPWKQELKPSPLRNAAYCSSNGFVLAPRTTSPGVAPAAANWALPHQSSIKKTSHRLLHRPLGGAVFS